MHCIAGLDNELSLHENEADICFLDNDTEYYNTHLDYIRLDNQHRLQMTGSAEPVDHSLEKDWAVNEDTELEDNRLEENRAAGLSPQEPDVASF